MGKTKKSLLRNNFPSAAFTIGALFAGFLLGLAAHHWPTAAGDFGIGLLEPLGTLWLAALKMLVLPLMVSLLIVSIGRAGSTRAGQLGGMSVIWFVIFLSAAAGLTVVLGLTILEWFPLGEDIRATFSAAMPAISPEASIEHSTSPTVRDWIVNLVPANPLQAAINGDFLGLIVATILFAIALRYVPTTSREFILSGAEALSDWCFALAGLLFRLLPVAVFILTLQSAATSGADIGSGLVYYIVWVSVLLLIATLILYPVTAHVAGIGVSQFARAVWPVQVLAISTRSSVACLPAMLDAARKALNLPAEVAGFVLPFAVSTFKLNMGISAIFQMFFLLHLYGIQADPVTLAVAIAAVTAQSVATPGLPSGAIWTTTPVYLALGIPLEGIVLTNVVDTIPDLFKTTANVTGDLSIAAIVARKV